MADGIIKKIAVVTGLLWMLATSSGCAIARYPVYESVFGLGISSKEDNRAGTYQREYRTFQE